MQASKLVTIKRNDNYIAIRGEQNKPYLMGFMNTRDARLIRNEVFDNYTVFIKSTTKKNIAPNIKKVMLELNLPIYNISDEVLVDNEAVVIFPKYPKKKDIISVAQKNDYVLHTISYESFIQIPFKNNVGLLIPYKQMNENEDGYIYNACILCSYLKENKKSINDIVIDESA